MRIIATLATNHKIDKRKETLQASGRKRNTFICVAPSCQASFRSRTLLGDDTSLIFPVLSTLGRTNLGRRVGFRDSGFSLSEACTPPSERSRGFADDPEFVKQAKRESSSVKMPKKLSTNSKAEEARSRKMEAQTQKKVEEERQRQETFWKDAEGPLSKAEKKKSEDAMRRTEAAAKRAEAKKLAEQEENELAQYGKRVDKKATRVAMPVPKVTAAELAKRKEEEQQQLQAQAQAAKLRESRTAHEDEYERLVSVANSNRDDDIVDAHGLDTALAQMSSISAPELPADRHPERRLKASFKAFEEAEMPVLKQEKPGLTHTQYKDMLWKLWKKSPDNPLNQAS